MRIQRRKSLYEIYLNSCPFFTGPPQPPYNVRIDGDCSSFSAKLKWQVTANSYAPIKHFIVENATSFNTTWLEMADRPAANVNEKTIGNLSPWARYRFRVYAVNDIGISEPSEPTLFQNCLTPPSGTF